MSMSDAWPIPLLYEDSSVLVFNKPAGVPSVRAQSEDVESLADLLAQHTPAFAQIGPPQDCGVVHRLDNSTSGCIIVAKTQAAYTYLRQQFTNSAVDKEYWAIVIGHPAPQGTMDIPIRNTPQNHKRMRCTQAGESGLPAHTEWTVLNTAPISPIAPAGLALVQVRISTGVRHQIRVHMAQLGHPLVGDTTYQSRSQRSCDRLGLPHHLLHASHIGFISPDTHERVVCDARLPSQFQHTLKRLDETKKRR